MPIRAPDVLPLGEAHSRLAELAEDVAAGAEKVPTKDGLPYIAIIDARRLDYYHALEAEDRRLLMLDDASKGLHDVLAGRVQTEDDVRNSLKRTGRRS
ncbi:hypothetical protein OKW31_002726 [Paraburkholderia atlantica]|uniref:hypothetical protein n=1 Tax=Paraburkholderia atlantica TaxID=2654982 RepID=UPI003D251A20